MGRTRIDGAPDGKIIYKPKYKKTGDKNGKRYGISQNYQVDGISSYYSLREIYNLIRDGHDLVFDYSEVHLSKNYKVFKEKWNEAGFLLSVIQSGVKEQDDTDIEFARRIVMNGGFVNYIKALSSKA